jgi:hypothetical protein
MTFLVVLFLIAASPENCCTSDKQPLREVLREIEEDTGFRILYRDAVVAGKTVDYRAGSNWQNTLLSELNRLQLDASIDNERKQIVIFRKPEQNGSKGILKGYIIDAKTGEGLPFANVMWMNEQGERNGTQTDLQGRFHFTISETGVLRVTVSYVGYHKRELSIEFGKSNQFEELAIRLTPSSYEISEIIVTGTMNRGVSDSIYSGLLDVGTFSPLGESNTIRMLQMLPAVNQGSSLMDGAYVRGSNSDALQVMLDGTVIYNHSHLFGLIDSFNADVIRTGSFYYDVTPARYQGPPGGTLSLITKTGSLYDFGGSAGVSNSVIRGSLEGPLVKGRASWLFAGRYSVLDAVDPFKSSDMISWGLNINRKNSLPNDSELLNDRIVIPGDYSVQFYDLHGKLFFEGDNDSRWTLSGYFGGDKTDQLTDRIIRASPDQQIRRFDRQTFETGNEWGNYSTNLSYYSSLDDLVTLTIQGGYSYYFTGFLKEDFIYQRPGSNNGDQQLFINDFENESELNHGYFSGEMQFRQLKLGASLNLYGVSYLERSINRPEFFQRSTPVMPELYSDFEFNFRDLVKGESGLRLHYFSDGGYLNASPRMKFNILPNRTVSFSLGYSRSYQYLYRLSFYNLTTADIWISATEDQKPASADHLSAGIYFKPWSSALFQVEGYMKWQQNQRFHEINIQSLEGPFEGRPWFFDNEGYSRGIEFLFRQPFGRVDLTQTYTYSISELRNNSLNNGDWFFAEWDRSHRFNSIITYSIFRELKLNLNWIYSTGVPDRLTLFREPGNRLGDYSRIDLSLLFNKDLGNQSLRIQAGIYNLTNRNNPWYREWVQTIDDSAIRPRLVPVLADVYDLGMQPSISLSYFF